jgi:hypothetical protein
MDQLGTERHATPRRAAPRRGRPTFLIYFVTSAQSQVCSPLGFKPISVSYSSSSLFGFPGRQPLSLSLRQRRPPPSPSLTGPSIVLV